MLERQVREQMVCVKHAKQVSIVMRSWVRRLAVRVRLDGHRKLAAPSARPARLGLSAALKVKHVSRARKVSIVKVKEKMTRVNLQLRVQIQRLALIVQQAGHQAKAALNAKRVVLGRTATVVNYAQKDMQGMEPITTRRSVDSARWAKQRRRLVVLLVNDGTSVLLFFFFLLFSSRETTDTDSYISDYKHY